MKRLLLSLLALVAVAAGARADDMKATPLTFEAITDGDITFSITYSYNHPVVLTPVEYKINDGSWTTYASWPANAASIISGTGNWPVTFGDAIHVTAGDKVSFRGDNASYYGNGTGYESHITSTADVYVYGNMMSLVDADDFVTLTTLTGNWNFAKLFNAGYDNEYAPVTNTTIKSHATNDLVLPATMITSACYFGMFAGCQGITRAPELPATTLESQCYAEMFRATGLTTAPALPATEMRAPYFNSPSDYSEGSMDCYMQMFQDCTSLTVAPALPATTVVHGVYQSMFAGCTSLVNAPVLPAAKVADGAYYRMFYGCTSLNYVKCLATDISEDMAVDEWMYGVPATGIFVKADAMSSWPTSSSGIPAGWTVKTVSDETAEMATVPLTFEAVEAGTVTVNLDDGWNPDKIQYKLNSGEWTDVTWGTGIALAANDIISFRGDNGTCYATDGETYWAGFHFQPSNPCYVYGNMMSLIDKDGFATNTTLTGSFNFFRLFQRSDYTPNTAILNHPTKDIVLPATTLAPYCYDGLFADAPNITRAPELPATTLADWCYSEMFSGTSITTAPALPATTLADACYADMFMNCTSLTTAPDLPAPTLVEGCYTDMFYGCTSLNFVRCFATDISADYCTTSWMSGVAATGTFVKAVGMDDWAVGPDAYDSVNGIPDGWTVKSGYAYTVPTSGVGTFSAEDKVEVPEGLTAHYCTTYDKDGGKIAVETIDGGVVPANTGVLLRGTAGETYTLLETAAAAPSIANNTLVAVVDATHVDPTDGDYTNFILKGGKFVKVATSTSDVKISANKAYLHVLTSSLSRDAQTIGFDWDGTTSINTVQLPQPADGTVYDLQGRKVNGDSMRKGLYIVNGKKIVVK